MVHKKLFSIMLVLIVGFIFFSSISTSFAQTEGIEPTLIPTAISTPIIISTEYILEEGNTEVFENTIDISNNNIEVMKWITTVFMSLVTLVVGFAGGFTVYRGKVAEDKANEAHIKAIFAENSLLGLESKSDELNDFIKKINVKLNELEESVNTSVSKTKAVLNDADKLSKNIKLVSNQANEIKSKFGIFSKKDLIFLATLHLVDEHRIALNNERNLKKKEKAVWALIEKTYSKSVMIRRESVVALSGLGDPNKNIIERFKKIVEEKKDQEIVYLAKEAIEHWEGD